MPPRRRLLRARPSHPIGAPNVPPTDRLSTMIREAYNLVLAQLTDPEDWSRLAQVSKTHRALSAPRIWEKIEVGGANAQALDEIIYLLETCLSPAQKQQLRTENHYHGNDYGNDASVPGCAHLIRRFVMNEYEGDNNVRLFCERWLEESLKNFQSLEAIETNIMNDSIAQVLSELPVLHGLALIQLNDLDQMPAAIGRISHLTHLCMDNVDFAQLAERNSPTINILRSSAATLESLEIFHSCQSCNQASSPAINDIKLVALRFLLMSSLCASEATMLHKVVAFLTLDEMHIYLPNLNSRDFFTRLAMTFSNRAIRPRLHTLDLDLGQSRDTHMLESQRGWLSAFNTLKSLTLDRYDPDDGSFWRILPALARHVRLRKLVLTHRDLTTRGRFCIPILSASTVRRILNDLMELQHFEFAPERTQLVDIGHELSSASELRFLRCRYKVLRDSPAVAYRILSKVLTGFLRTMAAADTWEGRYKLRLVQGQSDKKRFDVASHFAEPWGGKRLIKDNLTHKVIRIRVAANQELNEDENDDPVWVEKVGKQLYIL